MKLLLIAAAALAFTAPAVAATVSAFDSFNGTNGNGGFSYGSTNFATLTAFTGGTNCSGLIAGTTCLNAPGNPALPGAFKTGGGAYQSGSVLVPADRLILHPGQNVNELDSVYIAYTAPVAGSYLFTAQFTVQDTNPTGVSVFVFLATGNAVTFSSFTGSVPGTLNDSFGLSLLAGQSFGYIISNGGSFNNDSIGVLASVSGAVPEPATWALMIVGFGLVGVAARRKVALAA